jgi:hypothetical protein
MDQQSAIQKFELPRSRPYDPANTTAKTNEDNYILLYDDTTKTTYRCYLNGERVLVAYRFTVYEAGTYVLGTAVGESSLTESTNYSYPMEIVYCAADGTASEGNDGTSGSVIGSLDYVYDNGSKIINVQDYAAGQGPTSQTDYANFYFNSHIITYTDNEATGTSGFTNINSLKVYPYRYISGNKVVLQIGTAGDNADLFIGKHAGVDTDTVTYDPPGTIANASSPGT